MYCQGSAETVLGSPRAGTDIDIPPTATIFLPGKQSEGKSAT